MSLGGRYVPAEDDDADTPNCQSLVCQWEGRNLQVSFEIRHWYTNSEAGMRDKYPFVAPNDVVGVIFFGSEGYMIIPDYSSYYVFLGRSASRAPRRCRCRHTLTDLPHFQNWIAACRSRKHEDLNADVEQGHLSTAMCHLAKISNQLKRSVQFRSQERTICQRRGGQQAAQTRIPRAVRRAGSGVNGVAIVCVRSTLLSSAASGRGVGGEGGWVFPYCSPSP